MNKEEKNDFYKINVEKQNEYNSNDRCFVQEKPIEMNDIKLTSFPKKYKIYTQEKLEIPAFPRYIDLVDITNVKNQYLSWYHYHLPDFLMCDNNKDVKLYKKSCEYLVQELDVANILNKMNQFERLKQSSMTYDQLICFNYLFQSQMEDDVVYTSIYKHSIKYEEFKSALEKISKKEMKDSLDYYILSIVKV